METGAISLTHEELNVELHGTAGRQHHGDGHARVGKVV